MNCPIVVIPSYWQKGKVIEEDTIYDHPSDLLSNNETLSKTLKSLVDVKEVFKVLVIGCPTRESIGKEMDQRIVSLIKNLQLPFKVIYFGYSEYISLKNTIMEHYSEFFHLYSNRGYGNVRNLCLLIPHILKHEIAILIDDDELIEDTDFVQKATEFIGTKSKGNNIGIIVGFYRNKEGSIFLDENKVPLWERLAWNKPKLMNEAFRNIEQKSGRLVDTPLAFGGNMVIHKKCWMEIPFDPKIKRGEDMDYLRNAKNAGFKALLDKDLYIVHCPPESQIPYSLKLKEDIYRFLYAKTKLQESNNDFTEWQPYPGYFFKDIEGKAILTDFLYNVFNDYEEILKCKDIDEFKLKLNRILENLTFEEAKIYAVQNKKTYQEFKRKWKEFFQLLTEEEISDIVREV